MPSISSHDPHSLIAETETKKFLSNMWDKQYGQGLYFSALHEIDEHMYIPLKVGNDWMYAAHAIFDGFSILDHLNKTYPEMALNISINTPFGPPKKTHWLAAIRCALNSKPLEKHIYIHQLPYNKKLNQNISYFHLELTLKETESLKNKNLTAHCLDIFSKFFTDKLSCNQTTRWMIPVNIRGHFKESSVSQMSASYLGINCERHATSQEIKQQLIGKLKKGEQWGYWLLGKIGLIAGKKIIIDQTIKSLDKEDSDWFGSFSNLGTIGGMTSSPDLVIIPSIRWHRPIACCTYIYRDKLNLIASFHQSLELSEETLTEYKNEISKSLLSK